MAIRHSQRCLSELKKRRKKRLQQLQRLGRDLKLEQLEDRRLLATTPQLIGIQPSVGEVLRNNDLRNLAPQELVFQFNEGAQIDPNTLGAIQIVRSGGDGAFERARVASDFGTDGAVVVQFQADQPGIGGNDVQLVFTRSDRGLNTAPLISVTGKRIDVELNSNQFTPTTAKQLVDALNAHAQAKNLVDGSVLRGQGTTPIGNRPVTFSPLRLSGANAARATTNFNAGQQLQITFLAAAPGVQGNGIQLVFTKSNHGANSPPQFTVSGKTITIDLNTNPGNETTAADLVNAINNDPTVSGRIRAQLSSGNPNTNIATPATAGSTLTLLGSNDISITPGFVGIGSSPREVVVRFQESLPDDRYRIEVLGTGSAPLRDVQGNPLGGGQDSSVEFELDLGPQVVAVVPQPVQRVTQPDGSSQLVQARKEIHVYFNGDDLASTDVVTTNPATDPTVVRPEFYQLIFTNETVENTDDVVIYPVSVRYSPGSDRAILTFAQDLDKLTHPTTGQPVGTGTFRLRIGTSELPPAPPVTIATTNDPGSSFTGSLDISANFRQANSLIVSSAIDPQSFPLNFPGASTDPGHREIDVRLERHINPLFRADSTNGITTIHYNFKAQIGTDPSGNPLPNLITAAQKQRAREIFELFSHYLGVQFVETADLGLTIATGDMRAIIPNVPTGPGGVTRAVLVDPQFQNGVLIMDSAEAWDDQFGETTNSNTISWFRDAMTGIGALLGLEHANELPYLNAMTTQPETDFANVLRNEAVLPGPHDILHGQYLYRPDSKDIDLYRFELDTRGRLTAETIAERLPDSSLLNSTLTLYRERRDIHGNLLGYLLVARNDDYFSKDAQLSLDLEPGTYFIGVSASGNAQYNPEIEDSGIGGTTQGRYDLRLTFKPEANRTIVDIDHDPTSLDGDADGVAGGEYNFWFQVRALADTIFVDKGNHPFFNSRATASVDGSLARPYYNIDDALAAAGAGDIVRIVGNGGLDGKLETADDNFAYEIGFSRVLGMPLDDGSTLDVPQGVTVMVDSGALLKLRRARVGVGSSSATVDRSGGALQVLGTPRLISSTGSVIVDRGGSVIPGSVIFTSLHEKIGRDRNPDQTAPGPAPGDWGGIAFRNDVDRSEARRRAENRNDYESEGLFLNYVNHAEFRYGGGNVTINGVPQIVNPVQMIDARPTVSFNTIMFSADAALSANPNSFEETNFHSPPYQTIPFTADYDRIGPEIHHNRLSNNSINGLFVRIATPAGGALQKLTVPGRFDDTDIVHVLAENLVVEGTPGGPTRETTRPPVELVTLTPQAGGTLSAGVYDYKVVFVDTDGNQSLPSFATRSTTLAAGQGSVTLRNLPAATSPWIKRQLYRSHNGGEYRLVAELNANSTTFVDTGVTHGGTLPVLSVRNVTTSALAGGALAAGTYNYRITLVDASGNESPASDPTVNTTLASGDTAIRLNNLPAASGPFVARRIYRSAVGGSGPYRLVTELNTTATTFIDAGLTQGTVLDDSLLRARLDARLAIDPGTIVKLDSARIEVTIGAQLIAEGVQGREVIFTSLDDVRYGAGGPFQTRQGQQQANTPPAAGDWSGIYVGHTGSLSMDHAVVAYGGGLSRIEGGFAGFNAIEIHQARARITHTTFEENQSGLPAQNLGDRLGRGSNARGTIFVRGAQPIIVGNLLQRNAGPAVTLDINSFNNARVTDYGRATGEVEITGAFHDNQGPLIRLNHMQRQQINGLEVRGGTLMVEGVMDDTDIVHVVRAQIVVPNQHTVGGLRLESSPTESLVLKLEGSNAGFTATGRPLDIEDRIGGAVHIVGQPQFPVVMTSIHDCSVGAGTTPDGLPLNDTLNSGACGQVAVGTPYIDVVILMDESGSMAQAQQFSVQLIQDLEAALVASGIGDGTIGTNRYGLVGYGASDPEPRAIPVGASGALFGSAQEYATAAQQLVDTGVSEDGYWALHFTLDTYTFRPEAEKFVILVTNEDRDIEQPQYNFQNTLSRLQANDIRLQGLLSATIRDGQGRQALAADAQGNAYLEDGQGGFIVSPGATVTETFAGFFTVVPDYVDMVFPTGGLVGDFDQISAGGLTTTSFSRTLITSITEQASGGVTGNPGDWRSVRLDQFSHDRNVEVVLEREPSDIKLGPDANPTPDTAELLGQLAPHEKAGDDNRRLGFIVHGTLNAPTDQDVYSFRADAATEVWLDIDRTSPTLDTVVELLDANGRVLARSDNSLAEAADPSLLFRDASVMPNGHVNPLKKSPFEPHDRFSTNPRDAGMRLVLPGVPGTTATYFVRVRTAAGKTEGSYELQVRLREIDEFAGSTVQYADIRFATNGIEVFGQPAHSPLLGEAAEDGSNNNTQAVAEQLGNLLNTDRAAISVAGRIAAVADVDFFQFQLNYDSIQNSTEPRHVPTIFDIDYADGLGRANLFLSVFDSQGRLVLTSRDSNVSEDRPISPNGSNDIQDLSRGSVGSLDPFIGTTELPEGTYYVAVSSNGRIPEELQQYVFRNPVNPLVRLEPIDSVRRIAEDRINFSGGSNIPNSPQLPVLLDNTSPVPFHLGDLVLFVGQSQGMVGGTRSTVRMVDPFTGRVEATLGSFGPQSADIAMRSDGNLFTFSTGPDTGVGNDANVGNYLLIDTGTAAVTNLGDDGIETFIRDPQNAIVKPNNGEGVGIRFNAITFSGNSQFSGFAVGNRGDAPGAVGPAYQTNILYNFDIFTGAVRSNGPARADDARTNGAGTQLVELGRIDTTTDAFGGDSNILITSEATLTSGNSTTFVLQDGMRFRVNNGTSTFIVELDAGPQVIFNVNPTGGQFVRDGESFLLDGKRFEFDTGGVLVVTATSGAGINDGELLTITTSQAPSQTFTFEFNKTGGVVSGNIAIDISNTDTQQQLITKIVNAINSVDPTLTASALGNRITLTGDQSVTENSAGLVFQGGQGASGPVAATIKVEETFDATAFANSVVTTVTATPGGIVASWEGNRMNFLNATTGNFGQTTVFTSVGTSGGITGNVRVGFLAEDSENQIARRIAEALNQANIGVTATAVNRTVQLNAPATYVSADSPLVVAGAPPGGNVTGVAMLGGTMFAVSDNGGLFRVLSPFGGVVTDYVNTATDLLVGDNGGPIRFAGLAAGPQDVEGGRYANMLFGIDRNGKLYAFDASGRLQKIFANGATSVATGMTNANGLAFSTLDENLWQITTHRANDPGHGWNQTFNGSRAASANGGSSFYFGNTQPGAGNKSSQGTDMNVLRRDYNFPGGAHGSLMTKPFSLKGYAPEDQPMLYFNYFLETEDTTYNPESDPLNPMRDSFRVFIADESGDWTLLATNNSFQDSVRADEFDIGLNDSTCQFPSFSSTPCAQELFDNTNSWRQARIPLGRFAGKENLKLRFDFSTAGSLNIGDPNTAGDELRAVIGSKLRDGQGFTLNTSDRFEVETGFTIVAPTGGVIVDGSTFRVSNGVDVKIFEFDNGTGPAIDPTHVAVPFNANQSGAEVAKAIEQAILTAFAPTVLSANLGNEGNDTLTQAVATGIIASNQLFQASGTIGDGVNGARDVDMVSVNLRAGDRLLARVNGANGGLDAVLRVFSASGDELFINDNFDGNDPEIRFVAPADGRYFVGISGAGNFTYESNVTGRGQTGDTGSYTLEIAVNTVTPHLDGARVNLEGATNVIQFGLPATFVEGRTGVTAGATPIHVHSSMSANEVANAIAAAMGVRYSGGNTLAVRTWNELVRIIGQDVTGQDLGPLGQTLFGLETRLAGDSFGAFGTSGPPGITRYPGALRSMDNAREGVYVDDLIIGFAERGEMVSGANVNTSFMANAELFNTNLPGTHNEIHVGEYQLEIRRGADYGRSVLPPIPTLVPYRSFDTNDRHTAQVTLVAPAGSELRDGQTFTLSDGIHTLTFEFDDTTGGGNGVLAGHVRVPFTPQDSDWLVARTIRDAINNPQSAVPTVLDLTAALSDGSRSVSGFVSTSNRVNLYGNAIFKNTDAQEIGVEGQVTEGTTLFRDDVFQFTNASSSGELITQISIRLPDGLSFRTFGGFLPPTVNAASNAVGHGFVVNDRSNLATINFTDFQAGEEFLFGIIVSSQAFAFADGDDLIGSNVTIQFDSGRTVRTTIIGDDDSTNAIAGVLGATGLTQVLYDEFGDSNLFRDQGQLILKNNRISRSAEYGIKADAGDRVRGDVAAGSGARAYPGPVRNLLELNRSGLTPGVTITNNVLFLNQTGGILYSGDNVTGEDPASIPFGRILNNTIVGGNSGVGIRIEENVSPTVLNNIVANLTTGLSIDGTSETTVVGGMVYKGNGTNFSNTTVGPGAFPIFLSSGGGETPSDPLFVNEKQGNFYLAPGSLAIDSSIDSLQDRADLVRVTAPLGIAPSPILAPERDQNGKRRIDDPGAATPEGLGENVFKDRGAIDRADFIGPFAVLLNPRDNDSAAQDQDSRVSFVQIAQPVSHFAIQLVDGSSLFESDGSGINDASAINSLVTVFRDGVALENGVDYFLRYDVTHNTLRITPVAGVWEVNHTYEIDLANNDRFVVTAPAGNTITDGKQFDVQDLTGNTTTFEFESGYVLRVPQTFTLQIPTNENGTVRISDGETFTVSNGVRTVTFEFDRDGKITSGNTLISFSSLTTAGELADSIVTALASANLGLSPKNLGSGRVHLGSSSGHTLSTSNSSLGQSGIAASVQDGQPLTIDDFSKVVRFEFDRNNTVTSGSIAIKFTAGQTHEEIAQSILTAIVGANVGLTPRNLGSGVLHLGGSVRHAINASQAGVLLEGQPGVRPGFGIQIPSRAGVAQGLVDGQQFALSNGSRMVTFEFDTNGTVQTGTTAIPITASSTPDQVANAIIGAVRRANLGLSPVNLGFGRIALGGTANHSLNVGTSVLIPLGAPGVPAAVPVSFAPDHTTAQVAASMAAAIDAQATLVSFAQGSQVVIEGAASITELENITTTAIVDIAGNRLQPNRVTGETRFTIQLVSGLDFGDAPASYGTLDADNGARHQTLTGFWLGSSVDSDVDGQPGTGANGDDTNGSDDEDGVTFGIISRSYTGNITVRAEGVNAVGSGFLDAWIDFNGDGDFNDSGEQIFASRSLAEGDNALTFNVPTDARLGNTFARFRFSSTGGLSPTGLAADGEVEDYVVSISQNPWQNVPEPKDVNDDGFISPLDALLLVNSLNFQGPRPLPNRTTLAPPYYDVNGDTHLSAIDALLVINCLNSPNCPKTVSEGEGELVVTSSLTSPQDGEGEAVLPQAAGVLLVNLDAAPAASPVRQIQEVAFRLPQGEDEVVVAYPALEGRESDADRLLAELDSDSELDDLLDLLATEEDETANAHDAFFAEL